MFKFIDDMVYFMMMVLCVVITGASCYFMIVLTFAGMLNVGEWLLLLLSFAFGGFITINNCPDSE